MTTNPPIAMLTKQEGSIWAWLEHLQKVSHLPCLGNSETKIAKQRNRLYRLPSCCIAPPPTHPLIVSLSVLHVRKRPTVLTSCHLKAAGLTDIQKLLLKLLPILFGRSSYFQTRRLAVLTSDILLRPFLQSFFFSMYIFVWLNVFPPMSTSSLEHVTSISHSTQES